MIVLGFKASKMALADWSRKVSNALDQALAEHIDLTQSKLAQACPKDTGRMASSFYVGKDKPNLTLRPQDWSTPAKEISRWFSN